METEKILGTHHRLGYTNRHNCWEISSCHCWSSNTDHCLGKKINVTVMLLWPTFSPCESCILLVITTLLITVNKMPILMIQTVVLSSSLDPYNLWFNSFTAKNDSWHGHFKCRLPRTYDVFLDCWIMSLWFAGAKSHGSKRIKVI